MIKNPAKNTKLCPKKLSQRISVVLTSDGKNCSNRKSFGQVELAKYHQSSIMCASREQHKQLATRLFKTRLFKTGLFTI